MILCISSNLSDTFLGKFCCSNTAETLVFKYPDNILKLRFCSQQGVLQVRALRIRHASIYRICLIRSRGY